MRYEVVLWDFDGTLMDTSAGIYQSLHAAFHRLGMPVPAQAVLEKFIGPPLLYSMQTFIGLEEEQAKRAVDLFREDYTESGAYNARIYDGLEPLIRRMREHGMKTGVATLKPEHTAQFLLTHFGIDDLFDVCSGTSGYGVTSASKAQIIETALERLNFHDKSRAVLIGDTIYDAEGAQETGIDFVAAAYGFGITPGELEATGCVCAADNAAELERFFFQNGL